MPRHGGAVLVRGGGHLLRVGVGHRAAAGVCRVRYAFGGRGEGAGHRRWLVGQDQDRQHHGVYLPDPAGHSSVAELCVSGRHPRDHRVLRS